MDATTEHLSSYALSLDYADLPPDTVHETKRRIIDALGCAMGGYSSEPARLSRDMASTISSTFPSTVLGSGHCTSPEMAAFANSVMVRYLDCNDTFVSPGAGHPSDMTPAVLAVADPLHASGKEVIAGTVLAYEVYGRFADQVSSGEKGWDQGIFVVVGSVCAAGKILGLTAHQMAHAVSLAVVPNLPLSQTRVGELSMWKGCATAAATRSGVFAALLAQRGMEGPGEPFEGKHGLFEQATGLVKLEPFGSVGVPFKINETSLKHYPSQIHTQVPISLALEIRKTVAFDQIDSITLKTYRSAWRSAGLEPEKWDPKTRETADHSIPYLVAVALVDGGVNPDSFAPERIADPALRPLMNKISVEESPEFTSRYPEAQVSEIQVVTRSGQRLKETATYPKGHRNNPLSDSELEEKFHNLSKVVLTPQQRNVALDVLWSLEDVDDIGTIFDLFRVQEA